MSEKNDDELRVLRHSAAHVMASAVMNLFPDVKLGIGPATNDGFYYDFEREESFLPEDLEKITAEMKRVIKSNSPFEVIKKSKKDAIEYFESKGEKYKVEILNELSDDQEITLYKHDDFVDLCKGPHIRYTSGVKHFKLLSIAGAYWRGNEKNIMLQRIYGTAFFKKEDLDNYLSFLEEAKKRDHRKLGKELDLFSIQELGGPGLVYWHPRGSLVRKIIEDFWKDEHLKNGYDLINVPHIGKKDLWETSGHWGFYNENMFTPMDIDSNEYILKPMNCPGHVLIYKSKKRSYRELPLRWAELGTVYRNERSGVMHGLMRVRGFTQDDAHIFCTPDQIESEITSILKFVIFILKTFGFSEYSVFLSTRPDKYVGSLENWDRAENALKSALEAIGLDYVIDPGEGVFYGPKIDIKIKDAIGRLWQCSTIQLDFSLPERFGLVYTNSEGRDVTPVMIHRALMGSLERFFGVLIEHYVGAFPVWLMYEQVRVLTVTNKQDEYAKEVNEYLVSVGIRSHVDLNSDKLGHKIRNAQLDKIPYMIVVGDKEACEKKISVRTRRGEILDITSCKEFGEMVLGKVRDKSLKP